MNPAGIPMTTYRDKQLLVIDDEVRLAESLSSLLKSAGYQVQHATSGAAGLEAVRATDFDLVITDLRMEGIDGFDIIQYVVENAPNTALIIITAHASTESAIEAIHQRVADYIPKPFDFEVLRNAIDRVFAQQEAERMRRDLIHMLTHDIKVPLTSVLGFAQLIVAENGTLHPNAPHFVDMIAMNSQRILSMLDNYLTNARAEEGRLEILRAHFDLAAVIEESLTMLGPELRKKGISVSRDTAPPPLEFTADEPLLARAIGNLLSNAVKYTAAGGTVHVSTHYTGTSAVIMVANSGSIPKEDTGLVFLRYQRTASSRGISGSGLGLHVVRCVAEAHGGFATCESSAEAVTFRLEIPFANP